MRTLVWGREASPASRVRRPGLGVWPGSNGESNDVGGREILLDGDGSVLVETGDPGVLADVDHPDDLDSLPRE